MAQAIERGSVRASKLNIRQSERTTAEEVRLTQLELEQQLGGLFSLLLSVPCVPEPDHAGTQRNGQLPKIPKGLSVHRSSLV